MKRFFPAQSFFISLVIITLILSGITGTIAHYTSDIGAASTQEWSVPVEVLAGSEGGSNILEFGIVLTATDGFDSGVDAIHPPPPPGATFEAYFLITGPLPQLDKDYRGPSSSTSWTLVVRSQSNDIAISWNSAQFPSCISAQMDTGIDVIDMLLQDSLTQPLPAGIHSILITVEDIDQDQDGYTICQGDCDDSNENVNPGAQEVCNGIDDDCDGLIDDDDPDCTGKTTWHEDSDNDGYGNPNVSLDTCDQPAGYVLDDTDCDDSDQNVNPGATEVCNGIDDDCDGLIDDDDPDCTGKTTWHEDSDNDGYGNPNVSLDTCDQPAGYVLDDTDCDDSNENVNPGATEVCNGIDDDCDGSIDEGFDQDQDGYTTCQGDCDDSNANVNPGATEVCNGIDDDCDGLIDDDDPDCTGKTTWHEDSDNDGYGNPNVSLDACDQPAGYVLDDTDCDDSNANVNPGATEVCNGIDDDCDGLIDEDSDDDGDGYTVCGGDCDDSNKNVNPDAQEVCNGIDDDCNGLIDDDDPDCTGKTTWHEDSDNDGYGNPNVSLDTCDQPAGYVLDDTDCDDSNENVNPGATEICNGIDDDCDGNIDEGCVVAVSLPVPSPTLTTTPTPTPTFEPTPTPTSTTTPAPTPTPTPVELDLEGAIDEDGVISEALGLDFADGAGRIDITEGTTALTGDGDPLESLWVQTVDDPPAPTEGHIIGLAFDFGPPGASFDPALIVTVEYDLVSLEGGVAEEDLTFAYFDIETGVWVECECIVDPVTHTLTTHICHFTLFAILSEAPPPSFSLRNLTVSETRVMAGESVTIVIDVTNEREVEATYEAKLKINGAVEATQLMTLAGGTTKSLSFDIVKETLGDYKIEIDDQSVEFTVMAPPVTSVSWSLVITIIFGSIAVGSIFAIAIIWLRSRKPAAVS